MIIIKKYRSEWKYLLNNQKLREVKDKVSEAREKAGLTQKELAAITGLTQSNISNIEKGNNIPTLVTLNKIANATGKKLIIDFVDEED